MNYKEQVEQAIKDTGLFETFYVKICKKFTYIDFGFWVWCDVGRPPIDKIVRIANYLATKKED